MTNDNSQKVFWWQVTAAILAGICLTQLVVLWMLCRPVSPLLLMARDGSAPVVSRVAAERLKHLPLSQLVEGLARLDGHPDLLLTRLQARRLVPLLPLIRQLLESEPTSASSVLSPAQLSFRQALITSLVELLTTPQAARLAELSHSAQLEAGPVKTLQDLPVFAKYLYRRAGWADEYASAASSPIRRSLDKYRICDLVMGMMLLEKDPQLRLSDEQCEVMVPLHQLLAEAFARKPGTVGSPSLLATEAQARALLSEAQQIRLMELVRQSGLIDTEIDENELLRQFAAMLEARHNGSSFTMGLSGLAAPSDNPQEGPAVIMGSSELDLALAVRGIMFNLEPSGDLRLSDKQVAELALIAPGVKRSLTNMLHGIKDLKLPEIHARVVSILSAEQINYILEHRYDAAVVAEHAPGQESAAVELDRFLAARQNHRPYRPHLKGAGSEGSERAYSGEAQSTSAQPGNLLAEGGRLPLEAWLRGMVYTLESNPTLQLSGVQASQLRDLQGVCLNILEQNSSGSSQEAQLIKQISEILTEAQIQAIAADEARLSAEATGKEQLRQELQRLLEKRSQS